MKPFRDTAAAIALGASLSFAPLPSQAGKLPKGVGEKIGNIFKGSPRSIPGKTGGVIFAADKTTRIAHGIYASMSLAQLAAIDEKKMDDMAYRYYLAEKSIAEDTGKLLDPNVDQSAHRVQQITRSLLKAIREDSKLVSRYNEIKDTISQGTGWKVMTVDNPAMNAYCLPGGRMVVNSGLAERLSDDELAAVIGHEVMHAMKGHSYESAKDHLMRRAAIYVGATVAGAKILPVTLAVLGEAFTTGTVFSRTHEHEADIRGLYLARAAGYDPRAAISLWRKMEQYNKKGQPPEILSSHPSHSSRETYLQRELEKMGY